MKTKLPDRITTVEEAKVFLQKLYDNGEYFHPEDDATDIIWRLPDDQIPTKEEEIKLNQLMDDIYDLPGNDGRHRDLIFDPCEFLLNQDPEYVKMMQEDEAEYNKLKQTIMTAILELYHNGKNWILTITPEEGDGVENTEIPVTDQQKTELENLGVSIYNENN